MASPWRAPPCMWPTVLYGLLLYEITKPSQPVQVGSVFPTYNVLKVAVSGGRAYLAAAGSRIAGGRCQCPGASRGDGRSDHDGFQFRCCGGWQYGIFGGWWAGLRSVNVADPSHPSDNTTLKTGCWAMGIGLAGSQARSSASRYRLLWPPPPR